MAYAVRIFFDDIDGFNRFKESMGIGFFYFVQTVDERTIDLYLDRIRANSSWIRYYGDHII